MSFSKAAQPCKFCSLKTAIYTCPKCCVKYCSSECYRNKEHVQCSELFFRDWVVTSLESKNVTEESKKQMLDILKRTAELDSDDDDPNGEELSLDERFADIDLSKDFDENILWGRLTQEERNKFENLLVEQKLGDIVPMKKPWWALSVVSLVEEIADASCNGNKDDLVSKRPAFPMSTRNLSMLTSVPAADCVQYNVISVLYCYVCIMRYYNFEVRDFGEEVLDNIFYLAPVLSEQRNYLTLEEVVQDVMRLLMSSKFDMPVEFTRLLTHDLCSLLNGPTNTQQNYYTLCALSDLQVLISYFCQHLNSLSLSKELKKSKKKTTLFAIRKIDYLISWTQENDDKLKAIVTKLQLFSLTDIVNDIHLKNSSVQ